jgi:Glycosyl hydrolase family 12
MRWALAPVLAAAVTTVVTATVPAAIPAHPRWKSSARFGAWNNGGYILYNNMWNSSAGPQTIWADSFHRWGVRSKQAAGNTAVETYPCVQKDFSNPRVSTFRTLVNGFAESMPSPATGLDAEAADDVWLNKYRIEVMIWVDNHAQRPAGNIIGHAAVSGQHFAVWRGGSTYTFALDHNEKRGQTHILTAIRWLMRHRYVPASATLAQVDFGWEIAATNGRAENFSLTNYWLHATR